MSICACLELVLHIVGSSGSTRVLARLERTVWRADFFVVSGFLITSTMLRRWGSIGEVNVRDFYLLRFARIAPLLLLLLVVLSVLDLIHVKGFVVSQKIGGLGRALLAAVTFHINLLEARRGYLPSSWDILWSLSLLKRCSTYFFRWSAESFLGSVFCWFRCRFLWCWGLLLGLMHSIRIQCGESTRISEGWMPLRLVV
jgi:peptidoglycan/LPS O-acetylase OafA/YrhL